MKTLKRTIDHLQIIDTETNCGQFLSSSFTLSQQESTGIATGVDKFNTEGNYGQFLSSSTKHSQLGSTDIATEIDKFNCHAANRMLSLLTIDKDQTEIS